VIKVSLLPHELHIASMIAVMRQIMNLEDGRRDAYGAKNDASGWGLHIQGACGEMAVAKTLNRYWNGALGDLKASDVGRYQVRTRTSHSYDLIVHPSDPDDSAFILVTGVPPHFQVHGWMLGWAAKLECFWNDPAGGRPAFFVPKKHLVPIEDLIEASKA
jgi:hypothetical protein